MAHVPLTADVLDDMMSTTVRRLRMIGAYADAEKDGSLSQAAYAAIGNLRAIERTLIEHEHRVEVERLEEKREARLSQVSER
jgi:hypothetical protein